MSVSTYLSAAVGAGDNDRYATSQVMKVGDLTLTATLTPGTGARQVTCTRTLDGLADTPGTLTITGKNLAGQTITETLIPGANAILVTGGKLFASVSKATIAGWVASGNADTIEVGMAADHYIAEGCGFLEGILVTETVASAINISDGPSNTVAILPASIAVGWYPLRLNYSNLRVEPQGASKITIVHSGSRPTVYAP